MAVCTLTLGCLWVARHHGPCSPHWHLFVGPGVPQPAIARPAPVPAR